VSIIADTNEPSSARAPQNHRTIDRVTRILEEVVYQPGMTFTELARALDAPKSSVHGFVRGLIAAGWLHQDDTRFYIGPGLYGLTLASGHLRAGAVTDADLVALHEAAGITVFFGVPAGDDLIYVSAVGAELLPSFGARSNIRRGLLETAGGKALLAAMPADQRDAYIRRRPDSDAERIDRFFSEFDEIALTRIARNALHSWTQYALGTVIGGPDGRAVAEVTLVGRSADVRAREAELSALLLEHVDRWSARSGGR
jgi:DNA-binding IclR family transcriptional regulator